MADSRIDRTVRDGVTDTLIGYASGIDRRDWLAFRSCFTDECDADYGAIGHWHGGDEITAWMARTHDPLGPTLHRITNVAIETAAEGVVKARCYVHAVITTAEQTGAIHAFGWYDDELVEDHGGWRIAKRRFTPVATEVDPAPG
jgi:3-phenylpropionate/cinnamic acid dioxygenase small subunit